MPKLSPVPGHKHRLRFRDRPDGKVVDVEVFYLKGSSPRSRGIYLLLHEVTVDEHSESFDLFAGYRARLCALERASNSTLHRIAGAAEAHVQPLAELYRKDPEAARGSFDELVATLSAA